MTNTVNAKLICPIPPNYVFLDIPGLDVSGGFENGPKVSVSILTTEQKDFLAAEWREGLDRVSDRQKGTETSTPRGYR